MPKASFILSPSNTFIMKNKKLESIFELHLQWITDDQTKDLKGGKGSRYQIQIRYNKSKNLTNIVIEDMLDM